MRIRLPPLGEGAAASVCSLASSMVVTVTTVPQWDPGPQWWTWHSGACDRPEPLPAQPAALPRCRPCVRPRRGRRPRQLRQPRRPPGAGAASEPHHRGEPVAAAAAVLQDRPVRGPHEPGVGGGAGHPAQPPPRRRHGLPHPAGHGRRHLHVGVHLRPGPRRRPGPHRRRARRGRPRGGARQAHLLGQAGLAPAAGRRHPARRRRRPAGPHRAAAPHPGRRGPVRRRAQAAPALPAAQGGPRVRTPGQGQGRRAGQRPPALARPALRGARGRRPGGARRRRGHPGHPGARHRCADRRHRRGPRGRRRRGPAALLRRGARARRGRLPHAAGLGDRPRDRLPPAGPGGRLPGLHPHRRRPPDRPRPRPGDRGSGLGPRAPAQRARLTAGRRAGGPGPAAGPAGHGRPHLDRARPGE